MRICPPELLRFSSDRYLSDLAYREQCDLENLGERSARLRLLLTGDFYEGSLSAALFPGVLTSEHE